MVNTFHRNDIEIPEGLEIDSSKELTKFVKIVDNGIHIFYYEQVGTLWIDGCIFKLKGGYERLLNLTSSEEYNGLLKNYTFKQQQRIQRHVTSLIDNNLYDEYFPNLD
jgi:hypothetical protein